MLKSIKKSFKYLMILIGILLLVPTFFSFILRIPEVQTFMVKRITRHFSEKIMATITTGRVEYVFFNKLVINDLLIKDQNDDTLIYTQKISAGIIKLDLTGKNIKFGNVKLDEPSIAFITDTSGKMNLKWYLELFGSSKDTLSKRWSNLSVNQITITDGRFTLLNKTGIGAKSKIDFNKLLVSGVNGEIDDLKIHDDSTLFTINELRFSESSGFIVRSMNSNVCLADNDIILRNLFLYLDSSIINADHLIVETDSSDSFEKFANEVRINAEFQKSLLSSADLKFFLPAVDGMDESVEFSGRISGTIAELKGRNIMVSYRDHTSLDCNFDFSGLPEFRDTFIHIEVNSLKTNASDFEKIKSQNGKNLNIPDVLHKLGNLSFTGSFTGFTTDFVTYGKIKTGAGSLSTDISLRPEAKNKFKIKGLIKGNEVDLGLLTGKSDILGKLSMETNVDGFATTSRNISGNLTGTIDSIEINRYIYRDVALNGIFTEKTWDGSIKISDSNIKMDMLGMLDFSEALPEFDFTLNLAESNLNKLNFDKSDVPSHLSMLITANFSGNNIDNLFGEIKLLNSTIRKNNNQLELYDFSLKAFIENDKPAISLRSDFMDADLRGYYKFGEIVDVIKGTLSTLMPARFKTPEKVKNQSKNEFTFNVSFKNTDKINNFFKTGLLLAGKSTISGSFQNDGDINISVIAGSLNYRNNIFTNLSINAGLSSTKFLADLRSSSLSILGQSDLKGFKTGLSAVPDNFVFSFDWDNKDKIQNKGAFIARGSFLPVEKGAPGSYLKIDIDSTDVITGNGQWKIKQSTIRIDSGVTKIDRFIVSRGNNSYTIDGTLSGNSRDTLSLTFKGIDLSPLSSMTKGKESDIQFDLKGIVDGNILISSTLKNPLIESNIRVNGFSILGGDYGNLSVLSLWNSDRRVADINVSNNLKGKKNIDISGNYDPRTKKFNLTGIASNLPVDALNPLLDFFASGIKGNVSGKVKLTGTPGEIVLTGSLMAEKTTMKIDYLQTKYTINDSIRFNKSGIIFKNIRVTDERGNNALLSGSVSHKSFKNFLVDLTVNMDKNACLVLNTQQKDNELFYGTVFASGVTTIKSGPNSLSFDISAKTGKGTRFFIPIDYGLSVSESSFVTFINHDTTLTAGENRLITAAIKPSDSSLELNVDLDVTPDAEVQLLIDPKAGDVIKGRGSGSLNISLNKNGEFKIFGDYVIEEGDYLFTLKNILNKRFDVENGGKITFNGDVENAEIDLTAKYGNLKTSLYPILYPILQDEKYNARIPVEPQLNLSGKLFNPVVVFNIYLPNADEETRTYLRNAINTEEELSKQFLYLLVMNSFYADPTYRASGASSSGTSAMAVTTTEMLSNQVSNWLSQISNDFDVGLLYRPGTKDINSQELQVALSTQLLNDKVTINGNFGVSGTQAAETPLFGDFDIEYRLTEKIRFKVFNRYNNPYTGKGAPYTQGMGLSFKQDFNKFSDLLRKKDKPEMKKEEEISIEK